LGNFLEHLVGAQNPKGLKTPFKTTQPPAQSTKNQPQTIQNPQSTRKTEKKMKKLKKMGFRVEKLEKMKYRLMDGRR
jgi:hypothetical protein